MAKNEIQINADRNVTSLNCTLSGVLKTNPAGRFFFKYLEKAKKSKMSFHKHSFSKALRELTIYFLKQKKKNIK